jgi:malate dehydrogenase (oxaloacetate-decarboxylating)
MTGKVQILNGQRPGASPTYSLTIRLRVPERGHQFADVARVIAEADAVMGAIELLDVEGNQVVREITVTCEDPGQSDAVLAAIGELDGVVVDSVVDPTFMLHEGGTIEVNAKRSPIAGDQLSMTHRHEVGRVAMAIHDDPEEAWSLTIKRNTVAVLSDGSAVLELGDLGPSAAMPLLETKALQLKELAGVNAFPVCLDVRDPDDVLALVKAIAPTFGGINLQGIAAPRCLEIERRLRTELAIPVFHDDQHGTAIVVLAALFNALRILDKEPEDIKVVVLGTGPAAIATTELLLAGGIADIVVCDHAGAPRPETGYANPEELRLAHRTGPRPLRRGLDDLLAGADMLLGLSKAHVLSGHALRSMASDAIVFALANQIRSAEIPDNVAILATGQPNCPNQINNQLPIPGFFKGALKARARTINESMKLAAARAIANVIPDEDLHPANIIPSILDHRVAESLAQAVAGAAIATRAAPTPTRATTAGSGWTPDTDALGTWPTAYPSAA